MLVIISIFHRHSDETKSKESKDDDDESSSEVHPVISPAIDQNLTDSFSLTNNNGKVCLVNNRPDSFRDTSEQIKAISSTDPWIRRCDQPPSTESLDDQEQAQRQKSIQYETHPCYHSLSSTSDDCLSQHHHHHHQQQQQQHRQLLINTIDKDIEYVESRLRGQTTVSLPTSHSTSYNHDVSWRRPFNRNYANVLSSLPLNDQQQTRHVNQKYSNITNKRQLNGTVRSTKSSTTTQKSLNNESVKTVKRRIEKMKDQKAAKTLRLIESLFS